jgi:hypothetical protein
VTRNSTELQPSGRRDLRAYQLAKQLSHLVYETTSNFANNEFRLIGQMRGAAVSVFGNIAEGYGRNALGALIRSLRKKKLEDGSWHQTYSTIEEEQELYDV